MPTLSQSVRKWQKFPVSFYSPTPGFKTRKHKQNAKKTHRHQIIGYRRSGLLSGTLAIMTGRDILHVLPWHETTRFTVLRKKDSFVTRGVTIYRYIAIHEDLIPYRNTKFISQYIAVFLSSDWTIYLFIQFLSCGNCKSRRCISVTFTLL